MTIEAKAEGAFFDVDYTVLSGNSGTLFVKYLMKEGRVGVRALMGTLYYVLRYKMNLLDFERLADREVSKFAGMAESEMIELCNRWFEEVVVSHVYPQAMQAIEDHKKAGRPVVLLSAATVYLVRPLAEHLGVPHYLCNHLETDSEGRFTGKLRRPFCYGAGKLHWAEKFSSEHGVDLASSWYYSDSITDLPVLERFGRPVAVNPDPLLRKEAARRGWETIEWRMPAG